MVVENAVRNKQYNKIDEGVMLFSNNCIHDTDWLYLYLYMLFNSIINNGFVPCSFLQSFMVHIPKGAGYNLSD